MKNVLYIGNKLSRQQHKNLTAIEVLGPALEKEGYKVLYASSKVNKLARLFDMLWHVAFKTKYVQVVLIDTYSTQNFYFALIVSQLCRIIRLPYIPILHGGNLVNRLKKSPKLSHLLFHNADVLVAPSLFMQQIFKDYGYDNITYIPNSISITKYPYLIRSFETLKLLWVRSFSHIYNPSLAIHVLKTLQDKGYSAELCMVGPDTGDGSYDQAKALASKLGVSVTFTGKLSKSMWIDLAANYNVFINTTNFDNMPVSVIEAMALGLPVVSTNVGGMPFLIDHDKNGLLVPPNNIDAFVNAIIQLKTKPEKSQQIAHNARQKVMHFDWQAVCNSWHKILQKDNL